MKTRVGDKIVVGGGHPMEGGVGIIIGFNGNRYDCEFNTINQPVVFTLNRDQFTVLTDHLSLEGDDIVRYVRELSIDGERSTYHRDHNFVYDPGEP
jgi:hypothetical protein